MDACKPPPDLNFSGNIAEKWISWKQVFEIYMIASGKAAKTDSEKVAILLNMIGGEGLKVFNAFDFEVPSDNSNYTKVMEKFELYCAPKKNLVFEHYNFFMRIQKEEETTEQFFTELKNLAATCEFAEREVMLRDRIVLGTKHRHIQEKMLAEPDLSMERAVEYCRNYERTQILVREIQKPLTTLTLNDDVHDVTYGQPRRKPARQNHPTSKAPVQIQRQSRFSSRPPSDGSRYSNKCDNCGYTHKYQNCPANGRICSRCGLKNHFAKVCRSNLQTVGTVDLPQGEEYDEEMDALGALGIVFALNTKQTGDEWNETFVINQKPVKFKMDTGAQVNIINKRIYNLIDSNCSLQQTRKRLKSYSGHPINVLGTVHMKCKWGRDYFNIELYVVNDETSISIMGYPTIKYLGLIDNIGTIAAIKNNIMDCVSPEEILVKYSDIFEGDGKLQTKYKITLTKDAIPKAVPARTIPYALRQDVKEEINRMVRTGVLIPVKEPTPWTSPITIVKRTGKKPRICMDPRYLNQFILRERCWIPTANTIMAELGNAKVFTVLDASNAFHQIQLDDDSSRLCTIATPFGRYRYSRLPYGLSSAPEVFQRAVSEIIEGVKGTVNYMDDILVYGHTEEEHNRALEQVLIRLKHSGLKLSKDKTQLATKQIRFLGHIISSSGIQVDPAKTKAVDKMSPPTTKKELQRFLGIITYLSRHIPDLADHTAPLRAILNKSAIWQWDPEGPEEKAFNKLKQLVTNAPVLRHYDPDKDIKLSVDASKHGLGAVLLQGNAPVAYASASLTPAQQRFNQIEKELLAIVYACEHFHYYVFGRQFVVETDHRPLLAIVRKPIDDLTPRLQRLVLRLIRYTVQLIYVPGRRIQAADALSRDPSQETINTPYLDDAKTVCPITFQNETRMHKLARATKDDLELGVIMQYCKQGWPTNIDDLPLPLQKYWEHQSELTTEDGLLYKGTSLYIPRANQNEIMNIVHSTHQGITSCKLRLAKAVYWPGMLADIENKIAQCETCQTYSKGNPRETLTPHKIPILPWDKVALDFKTTTTENLLCMVDYHSKFILVNRLENKTAETVIRALKNIFAVLGIPTVLYSDNGPPFDSNAYNHFLRDYDITRETSSPKYPESNGLIERHIQTIKAMINKTQGSDDLMLAVLNYNATPKQDIPSPAELLMGRRLRTLLPMSTDLRKPNYDTDKTYQQLAKRSNDMIQSRRERKLPNLAIGQKVYVQLGPRNWHPAVVKDAQDHNSYNVTLDKGNVLRRNRRHLRPKLETRKDITAPNVKTELLPNIKTDRDHKDPNTPALQNEIRTRSGRLVRPPQRLDL